MILCGRFVLAMIMAPMSFNIWTRTASSRAGAKDLPTYPRVVSTPLTLNWSLRVIGIPCRGPLSFFVVAYSMSSCFACFKASSNITSVKQLVYRLLISSIMVVMKMHLPVDVPPPL